MSVLIKDRINEKCREQWLKLKKAMLSISCDITPWEEADSSDRRGIDYSWP